jgi:hypothetical protein
VFVVPNGKICKIMVVGVLKFSSCESSTMPEALDEFLEPYAFACGRRKMQENNDLARLTHGEM